MKKKVWTKTAESIKCQVTDLKLNQALKHKHNSRSFYKLPNGKYLSKSTEAMKKYLDILYPEQVEHEGENYLKDTDEAVRKAKRNLGIEVE